MDRLRSRRHRSLRLGGDLLGTVRGRRMHSVPVQGGLQKRQVVHARILPCHAWTNPTRFKGHEHFSETCPAHRCPWSDRQPVGAGAARGLRPPDGGRQGHRPTGAEVGGRGALRLGGVLRRGGDRVVLGCRGHRALWVRAADRRAQLCLGASQRGHDGADLSTGDGGRGETHRGGQHQPGLEVVRATVVRGPDRPGGPGRLPATGHLLRLGQGGVRVAGFPLCVRIPGAAIGGGADPDRGAARDRRGRLRRSTAVGLPARHHWLRQSARPAAAVRTVRGRRVDRRPCTACRFRSSTAFRTTHARSGASPTPARWSATHPRTTRRSLLPTTSPG